MPKLSLPLADRSLALFELSPPSPFPSKQSQAFPRVVYAAAHVVADPLGETDPLRRTAVDWDRLGLAERCAAHPISEGTRVVCEISPSAAP